MFSSVYREDVEPFCPYYQGTGDRTCKSGCWEEPRCITDEPTGGYLPRQHNPTNTILLAFRDYVEGFESIDLRRLAAVEVVWIKHGQGMKQRHASPEEIEHARRVLSRLAGMGA